MRPSRLRRLRQRSHPSQPSQLSRLSRLLPTQLTVTRPGAEDKSAAKPGVFLGGGCTIARGLVRRPTPFPVGWLNSHAGKEIVKAVGEALGQCTPAVYVGKSTVAPRAGDNYVVRRRNTAPLSPRSRGTLVALPGDWVPRRWGGCQDCLPPPRRILTVRGGGGGAGAPKTLRG